ncbi:MAG: leukotoxin LktA family filamentous adhesin, partial [Leptospiraceae bacterium]|nr:leukotoxin LktA family filamentous adhesin [Leptospiraceae bacterium]
MHTLRHIHRIITLLTIIAFVCAPVANAAQIITDGNTATTLSVNGDVTDITTATIQNDTAFNSFKKFNVDRGNTVNLHIPTGSSRLLNLVHNQKTTINGILNAYQDGTIGGNVYFANPYGIVVADTGVVNVGSLTLQTPTRDYMKSVFDAPGVPNAEALEAIIDGSLPIYSFGKVDIDGTINAAGSVMINAGDVEVAGAISAGIQAQAKLAQFGSVVNVDGAQSGAGIVEENGVIKIVALDDVTITGEVSIDGADNMDAGDIDIQAGDAITVEKDALISAKGIGENSNGGEIIVYAQDDAEIDDNAVLDASGGTISGNGGFIEFSAADKVTVNGGNMLAGALNGAAGSILLDPVILDINADDFTNGADKTFQADERINVNGVTISSRQIAGTDHENDASI